MSQKYALNFDQWKYILKIIKQLEFDYGLFTKLLILIFARGFSQCLFSKEVSYSPLAKEVF